ncbi:MAG: CFI-box-CTERM domain-containing protein [Nitrosarchaeum sp.]
MKYLIMLLLIPLLITPAFAQTNSQTMQTEKGTLDVKLSHDKIIPGEKTRLLIDFINPQTKKTQEHIDYKITVSKDKEVVFGPIPLTHTSTGIVEGLKVEFPENGVYAVEFEIEGILFQPIPTEKVSFDVIVGESDVKVPETPVQTKDTNGGGCLIATAAFGSELAPQVQQLRELRDNTILTTQSGAAFMTGFNQLYYSFSPTIADIEREQPIFKEAVKLTLTPMLTSLSLLNYVDIDSEQEMLGYGISLILLNIGMYVGIPVFGILKLYQFKRK